jgi:sugar lactone lactonase YvrE
MPARVTAIHPRWAIEGGRVTLEGSGFPIDHTTPSVRFQSTRGRVVYASSSRVVALVPSGLEGGATPVRIDGLPGETAFVDIATPFATGLHQVDNPVFDPAGNLYVTFSGERGQQSPVSIFRVRPDGTREPFASGIVNATSMAFGPDRRLYVSSRFEGTVYRVSEEGRVEVFASDLGVACGLAFAADGSLFVGDRSGTIVRVAADGTALPFATLPPSVAAFHLAMAPNGILYVTAPTLSPHDVVYAIGPTGNVSTRATGFGRPQGLAVDRNGRLFVVEALAGSSGLYLLPEQGDPALVLSGPGLVGVAFGPNGSLVVCSNDTAYLLVHSLS